MAMVKEIKKIKQDQAELKAMALFYAQTYEQVYFVRDMLADCIIAVEVMPADKSKGAVVKRANGERNIFGYQDLFMTTRLRTDTNSAGQFMIGYESKSGNDTRLSAFERGEVPVTGGDVVARGGSVQSLSPFERTQIQATVSLKQAAAGKTADYETRIDQDGHIIERFETFEIVRMK